MRTTLFLALVTLAGCSQAPAPVAADPLAAPLAPGTSAVAFDASIPADPGETTHVFAQVGKTEWDAVSLKGGTGLRIIDDPGGSPERKVAVRIVEGEFEGRAASVARKYVRLAAFPPGAPPARASQAHP